jgi:succinyl-CoA synthetase beta subunit
MNIHEYQAKEVLRGFGVPVPKGKAAFTVEEAVQAAQELGGPVWVVKPKSMPAAAARAAASRWSNPSRREERSRAHAGA